MRTYIGLYDTVKVLATGKIGIVRHVYFVNLAALYVVDGVTYTKPEIDKVD